MLSLAPHSPASQGALAVPSHSSGRCQDESTGTSALRYHLGMPLMVDLQGVLVSAWCLLECSQTCGRKGMGRLCVRVHGEERKTVKKNHNLLWVRTNGRQIRRNHTATCNGSAQSIAGNESLVNVLLPQIYRFNIFLLHCFCCGADCLIRFLSCPEVR